MIRKFQTQQAVTTPTQDRSRVALGLFLAGAGISHLTFARESFKAQVPPWVPLNPETTVVQSGIVEIALGSALAFLPGHKVPLGRIAATFFALVFPGNVSQYMYRRSAFGLDTDGKRFARLFFQPVLVGWALWATGALGSTQDKSRPS